MWAQLNGTPLSERFFPAFDLAGNEMCGLENDHEFVLHHEYWDIIRDFFRKAAEVSRLPELPSLDWFGHNGVPKDFQGIITALRDYAGSLGMELPCSPGRTEFCPAFLAFCRDLVGVAQQFHITGQDLDAMEHKTEEERAEWLAEQLEGEQGLHAMAVSMSVRCRKLHPAMVDLERNIQQGQDIISTLAATLHIAPCDNITMGYTFLSSRMNELAEFCRKPWNGRPVFDLLPPVPVPPLKPEIKNTREYQLAAQAHKRYEAAASMRGYSQDIKYYLQILDLHFLGLAFRNVMQPFLQELSRMEWIWTSVSQDLGLLVKKYSIGQISRLSWLQQARQLFSAQDRWNAIAEQCKNFA